MVPSQQGTSSTRVGYITDPDMCRHKDPNDGSFGIHHERPKRLEVLDTALGHLKGRLTCLEPRKATFDELQLCHEPEYINELFSTQKWKAEHFLLHSQSPGYNYYCKDTLKAALKAAGCVATATKAVLDGTVGSAFAAVRPPSHHAGTEGATKSLLISQQNDTKDDIQTTPVRPEEAECPESKKQMATAAAAAAAASHEEAPPCPRAAGFCFFSNIGIAATAAASGFLDAPSTAPPTKRRIVVLDWDVHHGDGLEEVLSDKEDVFFVSLHRHGEIGEGNKGAFYPGTGAADSCLNNGWNLNIPFDGKGYGNADYQAAFSLVVLPILEEVKPDLIIVAAGFDAVKGDTMGEFCLSPEMYGHMLSQLRRVQPKVVLALEGGYNPELVGACATSCIDVLLRGEDAPEPMQGGVRGTPKKATMAMLRKVSGLMAPFWSSMKGFEEREEEYNAEVSKRNKATRGWHTSGLDPSLILSTPEEGTSSSRQGRLRKPTAKVAASAAADLNKKQQQKQQKGQASPPEPLKRAAATPLPAPARKNKRGGTRDAVAANTGRTRKSSRRSMTPAAPANTATAAAAAPAAHVDEDSPPSRAATLMMPQEEVSEDGISGVATPAPRTPAAVTPPAPPLQIDEEAMTPAADESFLAISEESAGSLTPAAARGRGTNKLKNNTKRSRSRRASETSEDSSSSPLGTAISTSNGTSHNKRRRVAASAMPFSDAFAATLGKSVASALPPEQLCSNTTAAIPPTSSSSLLPEWPQQQQHQAGSAAAAPKESSSQPYRIHHRRLDSSTSTDDILMLYGSEE